MARARTPVVARPCVRRATDIFHHEWERAAQRPADGPHALLRWTS